jgi:uncharacterized membrane protein
MIRPKFLVFALIFAMMGYVLVHNERFLVEPDHPLWTHFMRYGFWILTHGLAGAAALLLAPFQFSDRLRKKYTKLHRVSGRIYVAGIFVLAPLGAYVQYMGEGIDGMPRSFTVLAAVDAMMLYITTAVAFVFALKRRITQHRLWMTRSYAVALVFFEGRMILGVTGLETAGIEMVQAVIWSCLALSVLLADVVNDWYEIRLAATSRAQAPARARAAAAAVAASSS